MEVSKIYEDWIEISTTGDKQVSQRLLQALNASSYKELSFKFPKDMQVSSGVYVTSVKFDEDTNTFTFVMSDGTEVVAAVTGGGSEIDLSNYATKQDLNTRVEYYDNDRIALKNHRNLLGYNSDGTENYNLAMVSKWNIADFGSTKIPLNLNSSVKPTVQVGSNEAVELSTSKDISDLSKSIDSKLENKVSYSDGRIELKNHKNLLGYSEDGTSSYNLAMVSKWGIADFGSSKIPLNLNSSVRPTIQLPGRTGDTAERIAFISDIHLSKDDKVKLNSIENGAQVNIIESISVNGIDLPIEDKKINIDTITESEVNIKLNSKVDKVNGKSLSTNDFTNDDKSKLDSLENYDDTEVRDLINEVDSKITGQINTYTKPEIDEKLSEKIDKVEGKGLSTNDFTNEDKESLNSSIKYSTFQGNRKTIQLSNYDSISGIMTNGTGVNIAMVSKWDIVDLGSPNLPINLNTPSGVRPTVQEPGQSGEEAHKIAYLSDLEGIESGNYDDTELRNLISTKVDKEEGKGLISDDQVKEIEKLRTDLDYEGSRALEAENNINKELARKVNYDESGKIIVLPDGGKISGTMSNGDGAVLAQINAWGVIDLGSSKLPVTVNSSERPKVQLPGQTGETAEKVAFLSDITDHIDAYTKSEVDSKLVQKANLSDIPSELPNPESLTIKYNGETKGIYDGSSSKEVNIIVTADTLTGLNEKIVEVTSDKVDKVQGKGLSTNDFTNEDKSELYKLRTDVDYVGRRVEEDLTNTTSALSTKVDWDSEKKVISLPKDGSISALRDESTLEGGVLLAQRTYDEGVTFVTEVGTTKNKLTLNASERPQIDIKGGSSEKIAYESEIEELKQIIESLKSRIEVLEG